MIIISDLNYLEAKLRRRTWTPAEDEILTKFVDVEPQMLMPMLDGRANVRELRGRQRELGVRKMTNSLEYHARKRREKKRDIA